MSEKIDRVNCKLCRDNLLPMTTIYLRTIEIQSFYELVSGTNAIEMQIVH